MAVRRNPSPGAAWQNALGESFNGKHRDECPDPGLFTNLAEARAAPGDFRLEHNHRRPHSPPGCQTPAAFGASRGQGRR